MKRDGHHAVLQDGFDKRAFAETLRMAMQNLPTGVIWFDTEQHCIYANSEAFRLFEVPDDLQELEAILMNWFQEDALRSPEAAVWLQQYESTSGRGPRPHSRFAAIRSTMGRGQRSACTS